MKTRIPSDKFSRYLRICDWARRRYTIVLPSIGKCLPISYGGKPSEYQAIADMAWNKLLA